MALPDERLAVRGEGVERVPRLVQERHHVVHQPDGVHEDERPPAEVERLAVPAGRLSLPAVEVEEALVDHGLELAAEHAGRPGRTPAARAPTNSSTVSNGRSGAAR